MQAFPRYALYYAPEPAEPLAETSASWLGYDPEIGEQKVRPAVPTLDGAWLQQLTAEPRRYGFHGTLKPPFVLAPAHSEAMLRDEVRAFSKARSPVQIGTMKVAVLSDFIALVPVGGGKDVASLAADCVRHFDRFRAPSGEAELAKRRAAGLTPRQDELLSRWGYPYVMEAFRFHLTLTGRVSREEQRMLLPVLSKIFAPARVGSLFVRSLAVFKQDAAAGSFRIVFRVPLGGQAA